MMKFRVHELAKELHLSSQEIIFCLTTIGVAGKNHMSLLDAEDIIKLKEYLRANALVCFRPLEMNSNNANKLFYEGIGDLRHGMYHEAIICFDKALGIDPKHVKAWYSKGIALKGLKKLQEAVNCFDKALEIDLKDANTWNNKCLTLLQLGMYPEATECSNKMLELDLANAFAWYYKGIALKELERYQEAVDCFDKALEIDPNFTPVIQEKNCLSYLIE